MAVLANPRAFEGKRVHFAGFVGLGEGAAAIFLDQDSIKHQILENSVFLDRRTCPDLHLFPKVSGKCIWVKGVIDGSDRGPHDMWNCTLRLHSWYGFAEPLPSQPSRKD